MIATDDLLSARTTAAASYATAVSDFWSTYIELHAIDLALQNRAFARADTPSMSISDGGPNVIGMRHPTLLNLDNAPGEPAYDWSGRITARASEIIDNGGVA